MQDFQQQQLAFIRRIKDPTAPLPAGMRPERMAVYEELFFNNLQNFINSAFPVLHSLVVPAQWQLWCRQFFQCGAGNRGTGLDFFCRPPAVVIAVGTARQLPVSGAPDQGRFPAAAYGSHFYSVVPRPG